MIAFKSKIGTIKVASGNVAMPTSWKGSKNMLQVWINQAKNEHTVAAGDPDWMIAWKLWKIFGGERPQHPKTDENLIY